MNRVMLVMTARLHGELRRHLFPGDGKEAAAVILCHSGSGRRCRRLIAGEVLALPHSRSHRAKHTLTWPFAAHFPPEKIAEIDNGGMSVITIHSHPKGYDGFSETDDRNDRELFPSVNNWFDDGRPNGAAVMLPDGKIIARVVDADGGFCEMESVAVVGDDIRIWKKSSGVPQTGCAAKLAQTFGGGTLRLLQSLRVGVVGCSGTGSVVIELLARNCVGELVLADDDRMEIKNLNRIINGKMIDAVAGRPKVEAIAEAVGEMGTGTRVDAYQKLTDSPELVAALVDCDIIFGCVDSHRGRYHLECIANAYYVPYFDVSVYLEADGEGGISVADAAAHYMHPQGESLLARNGYTMEQVHAENCRHNDPEHYKRQRIAGYLAAVGEEQPAVMSVNMQAACLAFNDFMARIHSYRLDDNREFAAQWFRIVHGYYESAARNAGPHPLFAKYAGVGDKSILVKNNLRRVEAHTKLV